MRLLAVDTTSAHASIAALDEDTLRGQAGFRAPRGHAQKLLTEMDRLLDSLDWSLADLDAFAVAVGPGSFTGLRIGIASVEGLAFATGRPVVGVSTLEATAYRYRLRGGLVASLLDARREEIFGALFRYIRGEGGGRLEPLVDPVCERPEAFLVRVADRTKRDGMLGERVLFAGNGLELYGALIREELGDLAELAEPVSGVAEEVGLIGRSRLEKGESAPLGTLRAEYLRVPDAEKAHR